MQNKLASLNVLLVYMGCLYIFLHHKNKNKLAMRFFFLTDGVLGGQGEPGGASGRRDPHSRHHLDKILISGDRVIDKLFCLSWSVNSAQGGVLMTLDMPREEEKRAD